MKTEIIFGCWDLFHVGHLNALKQAAIYCEKLYVGVFTDKVIAGYKKGLPVIPQEQRLRIIQHINLGTSCSIHAFLVDERKPHEVDTNYLFVSELLNAKKPVMVDEEFKGKIISLYYTNGISTRLIRKKVSQGLVLL